MLTRQVKMQKRNSSLQSITAAGGVLFRLNETALTPEILLIYRRGVWDLPKGKLEEGESIKECALREVSEEVGLAKKPEMGPFLVQTNHKYKQEGTAFSKETHWFAMSLSEVVTKFYPEEKEGIEKVAWYPLEEAKKKVGYNNLVKVLNVLEEKL